MVTPSQYNNPVIYILTMAKLDTTGHWWIAKLAKFNFTIHYHLGKSNVDADTLSRILWDQNIESDTVGAIFKAVVDGLEALMEVYICHKGAISSLILESSPTQMTMMEWVQAQKANPASDQVITWLKG